MTRLGRLVIKNIGLRKVVRLCMGADAYPVPESQGHWCCDDRGAGNQSLGEDGRNYIGPMPHCTFLDSKSPCVNFANLGWKYKPWTLFYYSRKA